MTKTGFALAAAAATLFAAGGMVLAPTAARADSVHCAGVNACKGQSACKTAANACKGQNACKGLGFLEMKDKAACEAAGGKLL